MKYRTDKALDALLHEFEEQNSRPADYPCNQDFGYSTLLTLRKWSPWNRPLSSIVLIFTVVILLFHMEPHTAHKAMNWEAIREKDRQASEVSELDTTSRGREMIEH